MHNPKVALPRAPDPRVDPAAYLRSIGSVRERCSLVLDKAKKNQLNHFTVDMSKWQDTVKFVVSIIKVVSILHKERSCTNMMTSAILRQTIPLYHRMGDGSTSM